MWRRRHPIQDEAEQGDLVPAGASGPATTVDDPVAASVIQGAFRAGLGQLEGMALDADIRERALRRLADRYDADREGIGIPRPVRGAVASEETRPHPDAIEVDVHDHREQGSFGAT